MRNRNTKTTMIEVGPTERAWKHAEPAWKESAKALGEENVTQGPWDEEPDKVQWIDPHTDLDCIAVRNHMGVWCGYVGVAEGHPYFERGYDEPDVTVHGGLTYSGFCDDESPEGFGICHVPFDGRPERLWWFGFDCGHGWDVIPSMIPLHSRVGWPSGLPVEEYRTLRYVKDECAALALQLKMIQPVGDEEIREVFGLASSGCHPRCALGSSDHPGHLEYRCVDEQGAALPFPTEDA